MSKSTPDRSYPTGFETFSNLLNNTTKSLDKLKTKGMEEYGLSGTHTLCLRQLYDCPEGLTRTELSSRLCVDRAQMTRVIAQLLEKGFVDQTEHSSIYRRKCVLTEKGRNATTEINQLVEKINRFVSGDIPEERLQIFYETFWEISENLKRSEDFFENN